MNMTRLALIAALAAAPFAASAAPLVTNGDFESATLGDGWSSSATTGFADISVYAACCSPLTGTYTGGAQAAFFGWADQAGGAIWQDIATVAGQTYRMDFSYGAIASPGLQTMHVSALDGQAVLGATDVAAIGTQALDHILTGYSLQFVATGATTRLMFADTSANTFSVDGVVDNVAVTAVPEPATGALFAAGLLVLARRRKA